MMGAYLSEPMTNKESEDGEGNRLKFGACSMQGWRVSQEDAHNCIASFDENSSLFAVYDGHGGAEVAIFLSRHLPDVLKTCASYKNGEFIKALEECYLKIDESIKSPEVIREIQILAKRSNINSENEAQVDYEEENVGALYEEATMPLDKLVAKYQSASNGNEVAEEDKNAEAECKPGSSKSFSSPTESVPGSSKINRATATSSSNLTSSSLNTAAQVESKNKVNGDKEDTTMEFKADLKPSKTETKGSENNTNNADVGCELMVQGKKIELAEEKSIQKAAEGQNDYSVKTSDLSCPFASKGINGTLSENGSAGTDNEKEGGEISKSNSVKLNGDSESKVIPSSSIETVVAESVTKEIADSGDKTSETPRRKKVHPTPITKDSIPERRSPRKNQREPGFELLDSESDDEEDDDEGFKVGESDSDDDDEEEDDDEETSNDEDQDDEDDELYEEDEDEDEQFLSDIQEPGYDSGSTAVVCFMKWEASGLSLWVANAGDSRCVVCREGKAIDMSHDHKPELDVEAQRIVKAGGKVTEDGRVNGGLNLSRALGDHSYKQNPELPADEQMISPLPSIEHIVLNPSKDKFLVLACDGIWNSMSSQEVVDFVAQRLDEDKPLSKVCEELFDSCLAPDTCGDGTGCDNMTAIIVQLKDGQVYSGSKRRFSGEGEIENIESKKTKVENV